jgi:glycosyltransferase involved in cell wall biosynthesis
MIALNNNNLRVLFVVDVFPPSICGIGDYSFELARALAAQGVQVGVVTKAVENAPAHETMAGVEVHRIAGKWSMADIGEIRRIAREMGPGAVVHVQYPSLTNYHRRPTINLLPALFRTVQRRNPMVVTMHGFHEHRLRWRLRALPMLWVNSAVVFVHPRDQELARKWAPMSSRRSTLIPIASNVPALVADENRNRRVRGELGIEQDERVAVFFGEVRPDKGVQFLLNAAEDMHRRGIKARAVVVSTVGTHAFELNSYEREILARLETGAREGWALLARAETPVRAAEILQASDVAAFPFTLGAAENRGSLMAAVVNAVPVLTTRGISTPPNYEASYGAETVPANDTEQFAVRLETLLCSAEERAALKQKAEEAAGRFTWSCIAEQTIEVYRQCLTS